jgi:transposase-like protein
MEMPTKKPEVAPTEVLPKARRRSFGNAFKRKILAEAEACTESGQLAALLRRHGLYSSHLTEWRRARDAGELGGRHAPRRGPAPQPDAPGAAQVRDLERRLAQMTLRAERAETLVELQKKVAAMLSAVSTMTGGAR